MKTFLFYLPFIIFGINLHSEENIPTMDKIIEWSKKCPDEYYDRIKNNQNIDNNLYREYSHLYEDFIEVNISNRETAYLVKVLLKNAGRNGTDQILLIRPKLETACVLGYPATHSFEVLDLDNNGVSEIVVKNSASGQGSEGGTKSIIQLDGWSQIILRQMRFQKTIGGGWGSAPGIDIEITWEFKDIDDDGILDLDETRKVTEERWGRDNRVTEGLYRYVFKNNEFIRLVKYKRMVKANKSLKHRTAQSAAP